MELFYIHFGRPLFFIPCNRIFCPRLEYLRELKGLGNLWSALRGKRSTNETPFCKCKLSTPHRPDGVADDDVTTRSAGMAKAEQGEGPLVRSSLAVSQSCDPGPWLRRRRKAERGSMIMDPALSLAEVRPISRDKERTLCTVQEK